MNNAYEPAYDRLADECNEPPQPDEPPEYWQGKTGKWFITYAPEVAVTPAFAWAFEHEDFDVFAGFEPGKGRDKRAGSAASWADCVTKIQEIEAGVSQ